MPESIWSSKLRELTGVLLEQGRVDEETLRANTAARRQAKDESVANQMATAEAAMRARGERAVGHAQVNYQSMMNQMNGAVPIVQSGKTALNGVKGGGVPLAKAGISTRSSEMTTVRAAGKSFQVNKQYQARFVGFVTDLAKKGYGIQSIGGYVKKNIAGTSQVSLHSYGAAIDINPTGPNARGGRGNFPPHIAELAARYGLVWGGNWKYTDPMHFEIAGLYNPVKLKR